MHKLRLLCFVRNLWCLHKLCAVVVQVWTKWYTSVSALAGRVTQ